MREPRPTRREVLGAAALAGLAGCTSSGSSSPTAAADGSPSATTAAATTTTGLDWRGVELTDVTTGDRFTVEQFAGQPVLLEFFAVWCPVCTEQQIAVREALARREDLVPISLNTDPNEDADRVRDHVDRYEGFDWRYAVAPPDLTRAFVNRFGSVIANPPAAPVIRVCPDGGADLLDGRGVKPADELLAAYDSC